MWNQLLGGLSHGADVCAYRFDEIGRLGWLLFFAPLILLELPQYYLPLLALVFTRKKDLSREERGRREGFLRRKPLVSVVVAGRNESASIAACIRSLTEQGYPNLEIIVVDDASEDDTYEIARRCARASGVRVLHNRSTVGRAGRPAASNLGLRMANGEILISLDADTTFDRGMIESMVAPFANPLVGVVAGNVLVRNCEENLLTRIQTLEYITSIDLHKRWSSALGSTLQASGAIGAFRRAALREVGGWDPELAEDGDICLRLVKSGWKVEFAPHAVALTDVPTSLKVLLKQRTRWDRGGVRAYFSKHWRLLLPSVGGRAYAYGMWGELIFSHVLPLLYPFYTVWLLMQGLPVFVAITAIIWSTYFALAFLPLLAVSLVSERVSDVRRLVLPAILVPFYRSLMRWVKIRAIVLELVRVRYENSFLPSSAWRNAPRY